MRASGHLCSVELWYQFAGTFSFGLITSYSGNRGVGFLV